MGKAGLENREQYILKKLLHILGLSEVNRKKRKEQLLPLKLFKSVNLSIATLQKKLSPQMTLNAEINQK